MPELKINKNLDGGSYHISDSVIKTIANIATSEISGIGGLSGGVVGEFAEKFGVKSNVKGVKIAEENGKYRIYLSILVDYGTDIPKVSLQVQEAVKQAVENTTEIEVASVDIDVIGVIMPLGEKAEQER